MDDFARQPPEERTTYFEQVAARRNLSPLIIEKDFWVCWSLRRLYELPDFREHLTFKGGTSLSKVFNVIERFSEDIDLSISRQSLGFEGEMDPEKVGLSKKAQQKRIDELSQVCRQTVDEALRPQLDHQISNALGDDQTWALAIDPNDPAKQTLIFQYPSTQSATEYIAAQVKIELGARSDDFPVQDHQIVPYLHEEFPDVLSDPASTVKALDVERTFWEKATILHALFHYPESKRISPRMSRHFYDLYKMSKSNFADSAISKLELLNRVATHKSIFFKSARAKYDEAKPGSLRLTPPEIRISELIADYRAMQPMFFNAPPEFAAVIEELTNLENRINSI